MLYNGKNLKSGSWTFHPLSSPYNCATLSVGVFKMIPLISGNGLKKAKALCRVAGSAIDWQTINRRAEELCDKLNSGELNPKDVFRKTIMARE